MGDQVGESISSLVSFYCLILRPAEEILGDCLCQGTCSFDVKGFVADLMGNSQ